jgi:hypothetical protein
MSLSEAVRLQVVVSRNSSPFGTEPFPPALIFQGNLMANAPRRRAGTVVTMPTADSNVLAENPSPNPPNHEIARRAFELYCERGCQHGHDIDDWLRAERELRDSVTLHVA